MTKNLIFKTTASFNSATYDKDGESWHFIFDNKIWITSSGFWRLLKSNKIVSISLDNGHQFGLPEPLDLVQELNNILTGKKLLKIVVENDTSDINLFISDDIKIEIFISSTGYETYEFGIENKRYIGLGSGEIAIIENK